jgi:hypothetical protein
MGDLREDIRAALAHDERVGRPTRYLDPANPNDDINGFLRAARALLPRALEELERIATAVSAANAAWDGADARWKEAEHARIAAETRLLVTREALAKIGEWDCLNPPRADLLSDLPWLRATVDAALAAIDGAGEAGKT